MVERTVQQLFAGEGVRYRVPIYQRHYVWNETHWDHLWSDIEEKADSVLKANLELKSMGLAATEADRPAPHFTGVIVTRDENSEIVIVDGQQRLTTFQIIFCALRDICAVEFSTTDKMKVLTAVTKLLQNPSHPTYESAPDKLYKLLPTDGPDRDAFKNIVAGTPTGDGLLRDAYEWFKYKIGEYIKDEIEVNVTNNYDKMVALSQTLLFYFKIVVMPLESGNYKAAKVFESLNGRGQTLTQFDLLRNNVFLRAGNKKNTFYLNRWRDFNNEPLWLSEEVVDDFLQNFLEAKLKDYKSNRSLFDLYQRSYLVNLRRSLGVDIGDEDNETLVEFEFDELQRYSSTYAEIANCSPESPMWFYQFITGEKLQVTSWHPLILLLKTELRLSEESEKEIFHILESYIVCYLLCYPEIQTRDRQRHFLALRKTLFTAIRKTNDSSKIVDTILEVLKRDRNNWPNDEQINNALCTAGNHWLKTLIQYILLKIECENTNPEFTNLQMRKLSEEPPNGNLALTLEHVMPKGWEEAKDKKTGSKFWPIIAKGGTIIAENDPIYHEKARARDHAVQSIGNLIILSQEKNQESDKEPFDEKKKVYEEYATDTRLRLADDIIHDKGGVERKKWDVKEIKQREETLIESFCRMWSSVDTI